MVRAILLDMRSPPTADSVMRLFRGQFPLPFPVSKSFPEGALEILPERKESSESRFRKSIS
jgi:hypothetical protein